MHFLRAIACWARHTGHAYGDCEYDMGPNGYHIQYRVCQHCRWVQLPQRFNDP